MSNRIGFSLPPGFSAIAASHPILSCVDAHQWEGKLLRDDASVWAAMKAVGEKLGQAILFEYRMNRYRPEALRIFALIGKGHNGGDALLAISEMIDRGTVANVDLAIASSLPELRPNTIKALDHLKEKLSEEALTVLSANPDEWSDWLRELRDLLSENDHDVGIDGLLGMQFKPPLRSYVQEAIEYFNEASQIRLRVAVDLPSGVGDESDLGALQADATFATGIWKQPLISNREKVASIRYLDIGFFDDNPSSEIRVLIDGILNPLRERRDSFVDKRTYGHLAILAGSRRMPGALAMSVDAALLSGVGLVTVFAPESVVSVLAASRPEAMWVPWPETPDGGLALEGFSLLRGWDRKANALLLGPGIGLEAETSTLIQEIVKEWRAGVVVDADALQPEVLAALRDGPKQSSIVTPHTGEFSRISDLAYGAITELSLKGFSKSHQVTVALKGANSRVSDGEHVFFNTSGNGVLARGGSGDILSGLAAGLLAMTPENPTEVACMAAYWHGKAADLLAYERGQHSAKATQVCDFLSVALEEGDVWEIV